MPTIKTGDQVTFVAQVANNTWPGPPSWTTSEPDMSTIELIDGTGQFQANLTTTLATPAGSPLLITIAASGETGSISGTYSCDVEDTAPTLTDPIQIAVA